MCMEHPAYPEAVALAGLNAKYQGRWHVEPHRYADGWFVAMAEPARLACLTVKGIAETAATLALMDEGRPAAGLS